MLGLAVLFALALWILITIGVTVLGYQIGGRVKHAKLGAFLGFMLLMGGWYVYWVGEYIYIQYKVTKLCEADAGVTVYITPEEWRKMIGEEEWKNLREYDYIERQYHPQSEIIDGNLNYRSVASINIRLVEYQNSQHFGFIRKVNGILRDSSSNRNLIQYTYYSVSAGAWLAGGSYKKWINNINDCSYDINHKINKLVTNYSYKH